MQIQNLFLKDGASLTAYLHTPSVEMTSSFCTARPVVIVCPGGAYTALSDREADPPALEFLNMGFQSFILRYHVGAEARHKQPLKDLAQAVMYLRTHAGTLHIDVDKIAVLGFSAGAHLAASLGVHWNDPAIVAACVVTDSSLLRPDAIILGYPVITAYQFAHQDSIETVSADCNEPLDYWSLERCVTPQTPPTFLWHTMKDSCVPMENSLLFAQALHAASVPAECHIFPDGVHGMTTCTQEVDVPSIHTRQWLVLCEMWLKERFGY